MVYYVLENFNPANLLNLIKITVQTVYGSDCLFCYIWYSTIL